MRWDDRPSAGLESHCACIIVVRCPSLAVQAEGTRLLGVSSFVTYLIALGNSKMIIYTWQLHCHYRVVFVAAGPRRTPSVTGITGYQLLRVCLSCKIVFRWRGDAMIRWIQYMAYVIHKRSSFLGKDTGRKLPCVRAMRRIRVH